MQGGKERASCCVYNGGMVNQGLSCWNLCFVARENWTKKSWLLVVADRREKELQTTMEGADGKRTRGYYGSVFSVYAVPVCVFLCSSCFLFSQFSSSIFPFFFLWFSPLCVHDILGFFLRVLSVPLLSYMLLLFIHDGLGCFRRWHACNVSPLRA